MLANDHLLFWELCGGNIVNQVGVNGSSRAISTARSIRDVAGWVSAGPWVASVIYTSGKLVLGLALVHLNLSFLSWGIGYVTVQILLGVAVAASLRSDDGLLGLYVWLDFISVFIIGWA